MIFLLTHIMTAAGPVSSGSAGTTAAVGNFGMLIAGLGVLVFVFTALTAIVFLRRRHKFKAFWGILSALFAAAAMLLCIIASSGVLVARPTGDPQKTVTGFFDALLAEDYERAYSYLSVYSDLGLGGEAADPVGQAMVDALRRSYSYELYGSCAVDKLTAHQQVQFTYLNLPAMEDDVEEHTMEVLRGFVETRPSRQIYDSSSHYLPEIAQEAYSIAVADILRSPKAYYATVGIQLELEYLDGRWLLVPSQSLLSAIAGGAA